MKTIPQKCIVCGHDKFESILEKHVEELESIHMTLDTTNAKDVVQNETFKLFLKNFII